jgi:hypothetical protein
MKVQTLQLLANGYPTVHMSMVVSGRTRASLSIWCATLLVVATASTASAQFRPRIVQETMIGDKYTIEGGVDLWMSTADLIVAAGGSGALEGLPGTDINAKRDLGLTDRNLPQFNLVLKGGRKHKLRLQYVPIKYEQSAILSRSIDFNGQRYNIGVPVNSSLDWKALRIGYEYDFIIKSRGYAGFIIEDKQTDVRVDVATPISNPPAQFAHARAPIPALGGIVRYYVLPRASVTFEATGFKVPDSIDNRYNAHYVDIDLYGTINATNNVGVKVGYRSLDLAYKWEDDSGAFTLKGVYIGVVARY